MSVLDITRFSRDYAVRELTEADVPAIYALGLSNPLYYDCCGIELTEEGVLENLTLTPPGKTLADKHFVGYFQGERLVAVLDLIEEYPVKETAYIGFFMVDGTDAGQGVGTRLMTELFTYLKARGYTTARLAYEKQNPQASHFWQKQGFAAIKEVPQTLDGSITGEIVVAECEL